MLCRMPAAAALAALLLVAVVRGQPGMLIGGQAGQSGQPGQPGGQPGVPTAQAVPLFSHCMPPHMLPTRVIRMTRAPDASGSMRCTGSIPHEEGCG